MLTMSYCNSKKNNSKIWALIPCAGTGSRSGKTMPKQYALVADQPLIFHTLNAFLQVSEIEGIMVVTAPGDDFWSNPAQAEILKSLTIEPCGGDSRAQTVYQGLQALLRDGAYEEDWVLVHDAARCLITPDLINKVIEACYTDEVGGILALPLPDTLKQVQKKRAMKTIDRSDKWLAQTPQMFRIGMLQAALEAALKDDNHVITDEASALEMVGKSCLMIEGVSQNFKVTYPDDFILAQSILASRHQK